MEGRDARAAGRRRASTRGQRGPRHRERDGDRMLRLAAVACLAVVYAEDWLQILLPLQDEHFVGQFVNVHMELAPVLPAVASSQRHICLMYNSHTQCEDVTEAKVCMAESVPCVKPFCVFVFNCMCACVVSG